MIIYFTVGGSENSVSFMAHGDGVSSQLVIDLTAAPFLLSFPGRIFPAIHGVSAQPTVSGQIPPDVTGTLAKETLSLSFSRPLAVGEEVNVSVAFAYSSL